MAAGPPAGETRCRWNIRLRPGSSDRIPRSASGLTPRAVLEKLAAIQMLDVEFPTTDGRCLVMPRYTEPETEQKILLYQLKIVLPQQPPPRIRFSLPADLTPIKM